MVGGLVVRWQGLELGGGYLVVCGATAHHGGGIMVDEEGFEDAVHLGIASGVVRQRLGEGRDEAVDLSGEVRAGGLVVCRCEAGLEGGDFLG